jgi:hypothetical protein
VCCGSRSTSKHKQSSKSGGTKGKTYCTESTLSGEELRLAEKMFVGLTYVVVRSVIIGTDCFKAGVVPLVNAPKSVS